MSLPNAEAASAARMIAEENRAPSGDMIETRLISALLKGNLCVSESDLI
jgi:hypothetical protein